MKIRHLLSLLPVLCLLSCDDPGNKTSSGNSGPTIAAVNYPLAYFAERLAGDFATIIFECPDDEDPAFWKPTDEEIAKMQSADVILLNGATYAKWAETSTLPKKRISNTSISFKDKLITVEEAVTHTHGKGEEEHSHGGVAFTTWIDLNQAILQATTVKGALERAFPDKKATISENFNALKKDLEEIHADLGKATAKLKDVPVLASHPIYQYFARAYGIDVIELTWEPEMKLDEKALAELRTAMKNNSGINYFMWEGEPLDESVAKLKELGLTSFVFTQCPTRPESGDFISTMKENIARIEAL